MGSFPVTLEHQEEIGEELASKSAIRLSPRPFRHYSQILNSDEAWEGLLSLEVFDIQGKRMLSAHGEIQELNTELKQMQSMPQGVYFVHVKNGADAKVWKLVKR